MEVIVYEGERHLQINDLEAEGFDALWQELRLKYAGFEVDFCYHNCDIPEKLMRKLGTYLLESCAELRLARENFTATVGHEARLVTDEDFPSFAKLHDSTNPQMYWTSDRIARKPSNWRIYMHDGDYIMMSLWGDTAEVFALVAATPDIGAALLSIEAAYAFEIGKTGVLIMVDDDNLRQLDAARLVGFTQCGRYVAYRSTVS